MGTDIHSRIETKLYKTDNDGALLDIYSWQDTAVSADGLFGRDYELFSVLADIRNYEKITPIAQPRGIPATKITLDEKKLNQETGEEEYQVNFEFDDESEDYPDHPDAPWLNYIKEWGVYGNQLTLHNISYVSLAEIKAFDDQQKIYDTAAAVFDANGNLTMKHRGEGDQEVGWRKIFTWDDQDTRETVWQQLIKLMEDTKLKHHSDDDVRLLFAFDS